MLSFRRILMHATAMRRLGTLIVTPLLLFAAAALSQPAAAQNIYAAVHGTVTDTTGAAIPGAAVSITNTSTGITTTATADSHGYYTFPQLQIGGPYTVTVTPMVFRSSLRLASRLT